MASPYPYLYFRKTHKKTNISFEDPFSSKNCPEWYQTPLAGLEIKAQARVDYWNRHLSGWHYEIIGWRVE